MERLGAATMGRLPPGVQWPGYDRGALATGIVHLGVGAFHRAHQAVYTEAVLEAGDLRWGIAAVSLRSAATRDALAPQDGLYTVNRRGAEDGMQVIGGITRLLVAPEAPDVVLDALAAPDTRIVTLTVTEKAYCRDGASGALDEAHPDVRFDLANASSPRSVLGLLAAGIARRRGAGLPPFTVLCCDNLPSNGRTVYGLLVAFARLRDRDLAAFIAADVACPDTMVDRIVPATTDADRVRVESALGLHDAWPVVAEPFSQWVIEDRFPAGRPAWEMAGATMVGDVAPFEAMKLRLLNASHSGLAYLGYLGRGGDGGGCDGDAGTRRVHGPADGVGRANARRAGGHRCGCLLALAAGSLPQPGAAAPHVADRDGRLAEAAAAYPGDDDGSAGSGLADRHACARGGRVDALCGGRRRSRASDRCAGPDGGAADLACTGGRAGPGFAGAGVAWGGCHIRASWGADPRVRDAVVSGLTRLTALGVRRALG